MQNGRTGSLEIYGEGLGKKKGLENKEQCWQTAKSHLKQYGLSQNISQKG
jgi:hypothetical protein